MIDATNIIRKVEVLLTYYDTSPFRASDDYFPLEEIIYETPPSLSVEEYGELEEAMTWYFGTGEWAGDTWRTYVRQWEDFNEVSKWDCRVYIEMGLAMTLDHFLQ